MSAASVSVDYFSAVESLGVYLLPHVKSILKRTGISSLVGLSRLDDDNINRIEQAVQTVFTKESLLSKMSQEDKVGLFGEIFADLPTEFQFLPGDRIEILAAAGAAKTMLKNSSLRELHSEDKSSLEKYVSNWFGNTTLPINCSLRDFDILPETNEVKCQLCPKKKALRMYLTQNNTWKITTLMLHIKEYHLKPVENGNLKEKEQPTIVNNNNEVPLL